MEAAETHPYEQGPPGADHPWARQSVGNEIRMWCLTCQVEAAQCSKYTSDDYAD
jgi:hypothetical protein